MDQQSTSETVSTPGAKPPFRRWRWKLFPLIWTLGWIAVIVGVLNVGVDRWLRSMVIQASLALLVLGLIAWFAFASPFRLAIRLGIAAVLIGLLWGAGQAVETIHNGDVWPVGMRFAWRPLPDELLDVPQANEAADEWATTPRDYPRFLGNGDWPEVRGVRLDPDWQSHPPEEIWRREIGAGWSSFAIVGDYAVTQEQRGGSELVVCYRVTTGDIVWTHSDATRFGPETGSGRLGGPGPRATPTIVGERIITHGATGLVNCLDARTGDVLWSHDTLAEQGADGLLWGQSGSPLVVDDFVVINVGAPAGTKKQESYDSSLVAYDLETGEIRWTAGNRTTAYASPVLATLGGVRQILQINENFLTAHRADDGQVLWEHEWPGSSSSYANCSQPVPVSDDRVFLSRGYGYGASLLKVTQTAEGRWQATPLWNPPVKRVMKTKFSNVVIRDGFVYGLDDVLLACIELESGGRAWRKRRSPTFGQGQLMLVGDHLLVLSETGELILVACTPEPYRELASIRVLDEGDITWNNPAFSAPYLLVRNSREAACYRLPLIE